MTPLFFFSAIFLNAMYDSCQYSPIEVNNYALVQPGYRHISDVSFLECKKFCKSERTCISVSFLGSLEADGKGCCALNGCGVVDERKLKDSLVFTPDCTFCQLRSTEAAIAEGGKYSNKCPTTPSPPVLDCSGDFFNGSYLLQDCCSSSNKCPNNHGDCDYDEDCQEGLTCGSRTCPKKPGFRPLCENCCTDIPPEENICSGEKADHRYDDCCTEDNKCSSLQGDCDLDDECEGTLVCGVNNCPLDKPGFTPGDDCCQESESPSVTDVCSGELRNRSYSDCCSPSNKCAKDHGDCDDDDDCQSELKCGINNCPFKPGFECETDCCY